MTKPTICGNNKIKKYKAVNQPLASLFSLPVKWMTERPWKKNKPINTNKISLKTLNFPVPRSSEAFKNKMNMSNIASDLGTLNDKNSRENPRDYIALTDTNVTTEGSLLEKIVPTVLTIHALDC